jgi:hypothetical protein
MLLIAIALLLLVWLLVATAVVAACRMAARGDASIAPSPVRAGTTARGRILRAPAVTSWPHSGGRSRHRITSA